eukprot:349650-Chlamydomonas_euryale.AAC.1
MRWQGLGPTSSHPKKWQINGVEEAEKWRRMSGRGRDREVAGKWHGGGREVAWRWQGRGGEVEGLTSFQASRMAVLVRGSPGWQSSGMLRPFIPQCTDATVWRPAYVGMRS